MPSFNPEQLSAKFASMGHLPTLPAAASQALAVANQPDCSLRELAAVVHRDAALATSLLKLVNSSFYAARQRIESLHQAIVRLGLRETRHLLVAVCMRSVFLKVPRKLADARDRLWTHSSQCGLLAHRLGLRLGLKPGGAEFAAGLTHDLGKLLLAVGFPELFDRLYQKRGATTPADLLQEQELLGFDHCQMGAWVAELWRLPEAITEAVQFHHAPRQAARQGATATLVAVANLMDHPDVDTTALAQSEPWAVLQQRFPAAAAWDPAGLRDELTAEMAGADAAACLA